MSNFLAIATVTATLSRMLQAAVGKDVPGATVTAGRPDESGARRPLARVNLFLYQVTSNAAWRNDDLPARRSNGSLVQRPRAALDLHYLMTFYGDELFLEPQRLLGSVVRIMHSRPMLTREAIRTTIASDAFNFLAASNLADEVEMVKFTPLPLSLEELSKLWSVYFQTQYSLSVAYQGTVVLIEGEEAAQAALPVRKRNIYVTPFRQPVIERIRAESVAAEEGAEQSIIAGSKIIIQGERLRGDTTSVLVGGIDATSQVESLSDAELILTLPDGLRAGVQGLQVVQSMSMGTPLAPHRGVESNLAAFVLSPALQKKPDGSPEIAISALAIAGDETRSASVTLKITPAVGKRQRATLLMNELNPPSDRPARAYSFDAMPRDKPANPEATETLVFPISGVFKGNYLVRVQVDGAGSPLEHDSNSANPVYIGPKMTIL
jgi:hypothetical protein